MPLKQHISHQPRQHLYLHNITWHRHPTNHGQDNHQANLPQTSVSRKGTTKASNVGIHHSGAPATMYIPPSPHTHHCPTGTLHGTHNTTLEAAKDATKTTGTPHTQTCRRHTTTSCIAIHVDMTWTMMDLPVPLASPAATFPMSNATRHTCARVQV